MSQKNPIVGKSIAFTFADGQMAGKTFEHTFDADGSVSFQSVDGDERGKPTHVDHCEVETVRDDVYAISYMGDAGYTLTVILDFDSEELVSFASNDKGVTVQHGTFEVEGERKAKGKTSAKSATKPKTGAKSKSDHVEHARATHR
jgi:hypothetical protein